MSRRTSPSFLDTRLGKGVVIANDTPGFIANRLGLFGVVRLLELVAAGTFTIEEIDARDRSADRTAEERDIQDDGHRGDRHPRDGRGRSRATIAGSGAPAVSAAGVRAVDGRARHHRREGGSGFLQARRRRGGSDDSRRSTSRRWSFARRAQPKLPGLEAAKANARSRHRVSARCFSRAIAPASCCDRRSAPRWSTPPRSRLKIAARRSTMSIVRCDGDSAGSSAHSRRGMRSASAPCSTRAASRHRRRWCSSCSTPAAIASETHGLPPAAPDLLILQTAKSRNTVVRKNAGASLVDLGDGVLARRVSLEDERDRRRHARDAARRRRRSHRQLRRARRRLRSRAFFSRRQS